MCRARVRHTTCVCLCVFSRIHDGPFIWTDLDICTDGELKEALLKLLKEWLFDNSKTIAGWSKVDVLEVLLEDSGWRLYLGNDCINKMHARVLELVGSTEWAPEPESDEAEKERGSNGDKDEVELVDGDESFEALLEEATEEVEEEAEGDFDFDACFSNISNIRKYRVKVDPTGSAGDGPDNEDFDVTEEVQVSKWKAMPEDGVSSKRRDLLEKLRHQDLQELLKVVDVEKQAHVDALLRLDGMKDGAEGYEKAAAAVRRIVSSCIVEAGASCTRGRVLCARARV